MKRFVVEATEDGMRFDAFLAARLPEFSRVRLRQVINAAEALVDGKRRKAAYRLSTDQQVDVQLPSIDDRPPPPTEAEQIPLDVLYEDDQIIAINKPHGMVVHPSKGHWSGTLTAALSYHFGQLSQVGGSHRPGIVHRLDRDTSGVIVIAKTDAAHLALAQEFEQRRVEKEYFAIVRGRMDRDRDQIDLPIGVHPYQREKMSIRADHTTSREASTFYEVQRRIGAFSIVRVFPRTGRTHQIRVHLSHVGYPVACDPLYGGHRILTAANLSPRGNPDEILLDRLALHAHRLRINHPVSGEPLQLEAPIAPALLDFVAALERFQDDSRRSS